MRQISKVLTQEDNDAFDMKKLNLKYLTLTQYDQSFSNVSVLYSKENIEVDIENLKDYYLNLYLKFFNNDEKLYV